MIPAGQMLGKYKILRQLGAGGMSDVYEAIDTSLERKVALKVLPAEFGGDGEAVQRFRKEVLAVAALDHPGIVTIFEVDATEQYQYYSMTLLDEGNLKRLLLDRTLPPVEALKMLRSLADALGHAHEAGLIHRDIKPENILFSRKGEPVIVDFGIAKKVSGNTRITAIGTSVGTPFYMSPEQAQASSNVDARSDIYSLGVLLFEMLRGTVPYDATTAVGVALQHVNDPVPDLGPELATIQPLLNRMMAKQPDQRPADAAALIAEIDDTLKRLESAPADATQVISATPAAKSEPPAQDRPDPPPRAPDPSETETQPPEPREQVPNVVDTPQRPAPAPVATDQQTEFELMAVTPSSNPALNEQTAAASHERKARREAEPPEPAEPEPKTPLETHDETDDGEADRAAGDPPAEAPEKPDPEPPVTPARKTPPPPPKKPPPPAPASAEDPQLARTTALPMLTPEDLVDPKPPPAAAEKAADSASAPGSSAAEDPGQERWRSGDLYEKPPPPPIWRRPTVWATVAALVLLTLVGVFFGTRQEGEPTPVELITGESEDGPQGIGLRPPIQREPQDDRADSAIDPFANPTEDEGDVEGDDEADEINLDALLLEQLESETPSTPDQGEDEPGQSAGPRDSVEEQPAPDPELNAEPPAQQVSGPGTAAPGDTNPRVAQLLLDATLFEAADQLTLPAGENAWEAYQQALDLEPANREALRGLARLQATYVSRAEAAVAASNAAGAAAAIERLAFIDPDHPDLDRLRNLLQALRSEPGTANSRPVTDPLKSGGNGPEMIALAGGELVLTTGSGRAVSIPAFALSRTEVTVEQFRFFVSESGYASPAESDGGCNYWLFNWRQRADKNWQSPGFNQSGDHPVVCVSRADAFAYARWLSGQTGQRYRLPGELEWEYAARFGGAGAAYWTDSRDACDFANVSDIDRADRHNLEISADNIFGCRDGRVTTAPVASYAATPAGFFDLLGNAAEWVSDCRGADSATPCNTGVVRGGSWFEKPGDVGTHVRLEIDPAARFSHIGFRVARDL